MSGYLYFQDQVRHSDGDEYEDLLRKGWRAREDPPTTEPNQYPFWNTETQEWEVKEQEAPIAEWSSLDFLLRFTLDERAEMTLKSKDNYLISDFRILCASAGKIRANHPITIQGMNFLKSIGIITQERINQILDPFWSPNSVN